MYVVDCKIEESLADNNINIDITKNTVSECLLLADYKLYYQRQRE